LVLQNFETFDFLDIITLSIEKPPQRLQNVQSKLAPLNSWQINQKLNQWTSDAHGFIDIGANPTYEYCKKKFKYDDAYHGFFQVLSGSIYILPNDFIVFKNLL